MSSVIHLQFWAYGSWDSLFPIAMSPNCKLMSPKHYFKWQVCNIIASRDSLGLAEIKTYAQKMQDAQVTKSLCPIVYNYWNLFNFGVCKGVKRFGKQSRKYTVYSETVIKAIV